MLDRCTIPTTVRTTVVSHRSWVYLVGSNGTERVDAVSAMTADALEPWKELIASAAVLLDAQHPATCWRTWTGRPVLTVETPEAVLVFALR